MEKFSFSDNIYKTIKLTKQPQNNKGKKRKTEKVKFGAWTKSGSLTDEWSG
jgi:hypothetical protein